MLDARMESRSLGAHPGIPSLLIGYVLLGLQPIPVALVAAYGVGAPETVFARFLFSALAVGVICAARKRGLTTKQPSMLFLRGLLGGTAVLLYFCSIQWAGAARGTLLNYTYPLWANLFGAFLGQRASLKFWLCLLLSLGGLWLVVVPESGFGRTTVGLGELCGLGSAFFAGGAVLTIKKLRSTDESLTIIASFTVFGLLMSLPFLETSRMYALARPAALLLVLLVGFFAFLGHLFFTHGYRGVRISDATLLSLIVPIVASLSGILLLGEEASLRFWGGATLILGSTLAVLWTPPTKETPTQSPASRSAT
jgi:drug/metabolite transporter (DMT)-like permease